MRPQSRDLTGFQVGRLTAIRCVGYDDKRRSMLWLCACACGRSLVLRTQVLTKKHEPTRSCGCLKREVDVGKVFKHGGYKTREYWAWVGLRSRCRSSHPNYGGRGIKVCDRWEHSFPAFLSDMGPRPSPSHSIDRIDPNGNYEPENCRWATKAEQNSNRRGDLIRIAKILARYATEAPELIKRLRIELLGQADNPQLITHRHPAVSSSGASSSPG